MALTKISRSLLDTGISDSSDATAITIDSSENVTVNNGTLTSSGANGVGNQGFHITDTGYSKTHKIFGDNSLHIQADSGQQILFKPNATEAARFDASGNLGIGTSSPETLVEISGSADNGLLQALQITNTDHANGETGQKVAINFKLSRGGTMRDAARITAGKDGDWNDATGADSHIAFDTTNNDQRTEKARITAAGNVFLNQTATADSGVADGRLEITRGSQHCINCHVAGTGNSTLVAFINDNGFVGGINTNGSATVYNTSSDARLKNVLGKAKGLEVVNALNPVNFEWKSDGKIQDGLIAQEVEKVFPDAVSEPELEGEWYSVDYSKLVTPMIKAIQEQQAQIEALQSEINTLKGE